MSLNIIFAGTSEFAVIALEALVASSHSIIAVYTPPDRPAGRGLKLQPSPVKLAALRHNIPIYQPATLRDLEAQETLKNLNADLMVVAVYGLFIPPPVLVMPRFGCINIHPSLLPRWRGAAPVIRPIEAGDTETGVTIMQLDEGWDTGDLWLSTRCPITPDETNGSLYQKLAPMSATLLLQTIAMIEEGTARPMPQNEAEATHAAKIDKAETHLDWQQPAVVLERKIRAFNPHPMTYTLWNEKALRIWRAAVVSEVHDKGPGEVIAINHSGIHVATGEGVLQLLEVQLAGGKPLAVRDFLHGQGRTLKVGEKLV